MNWSVMDTPELLDAQSCYGIISDEINAFNGQLNVMVVIIIILSIALIFCLWLLLLKHPFVKYLFERHASDTAGKREPEDPPLPA